MRANRMLGAVLVLVLSTVSSAQSGVLDGNGVVLGNGVVEFKFFKNGATGDVELDVTDAASGHAFRHRAAGVWELEVLDLNNRGFAYPSIQSIESAGCDPAVSWIKVTGGGVSTLTLFWTGCTGGDVTGTIDVQLSLVLADGADTADWELTATSDLSGWAFWSGALRFSIEEDAGVTHRLLDPLGYLTTDPAANLPDWAIGEPDSPTFDRPALHYVAQLAAYYDDQGRGLYLQHADELAVEPKSHFFKRVAGQGGEPDRMDYRLRRYTDDVFNEAASYGDLEARVGRFTGDWYDAASRYLAWLESTLFAGVELLADRDDIADEFKRLQMLLPLGIGVDDYSEVDPLLGDMAARIKKLKLGPAGEPTLDYVATFQFGLEWTVDDECGMGEYLLDGANDLWPDNIAMLDEAGLTHVMYLLDHLYAHEWPFGGPGSFCCYSPTAPCTFVPNDTFFAEGWDQIAFRGIGGNLQVFGACSCVKPVFGGPPPPPPANHPPQSYIDPHEEQWLARMDDVAAELATAGVDGLYVDNLLLDYFVFCFGDVADGHSHLPGYGSYLADGYAHTMERLLDAGRAANPDGIFFVAQEVGAQESTIPVAGWRDAERERSDLMLDDDDWDGRDDNPHTVKVPLYAVLYHHYAVGRPGNALRPYTLEDSHFVFPGENPPPYPPDSQYSTLTTVPGINTTVDERRAVARRGAAYVMAYDVVNGNSLFSNEAFTYTHNPLIEPWSWEHPLAPMFPDYVAMNAYQRLLCSYLGVNNGTVDLERFLSTGKRLRDVPTVDPLETVSVLLPWVARSYPVSEFEPKPKLVQGVWRDVASGDVGIALANHTAGPIAADAVKLDFDPEDYGLSATVTYNVFRVTPQTKTLFTTFQGPTEIALPDMPAESILFLEIAP